MRFDSEAQHEDLRRDCACTLIYEIVSHDKFNEFSRDVNF